MTASAILSFIDMSDSIIHQIFAFSFQKSVSDHFQPHHDHLLPWRLFHRTNRPPLSFSLSSLSLSLILLWLFIELWLTLTHQPPLSSVSHLLLLPKYTFEVIPSAGGRPSSLLIPVTSPASAVSTSGRKPLQQLSEVGPVSRTGRGGRWGCGWGGFQPSGP